MKLFVVISLILSSWAVIAKAGVGVTTAEVERKALALWNKFCGDQSEGGNEEGLFVYCKRSRGAIRQTLQHNVDLSKPNTPKEHVIFIRPPQRHYNHEIVVRGGGVAARKLTVYVKAPSNTHTIQLNDQTQPGSDSQKPMIYFLKNGHSLETATEAASEPVVPENTYLPPSTPAPTYLPPTTPPPTYLPPSTNPPEERPGYSYRKPSRRFEYQGQK